MNREDEWSGPGRERGAVTHFVFRHFFCFLWLQHNTLIWALAHLKATVAAGAVAQSLVTEAAGLGAVLVHVSTCEDCRRAWLASHPPLAAQPAPVLGRPLN